MLEARKSKPGELSVEVSIHFDPKQLRKLQQDQGEKEATKLLTAFVSKQLDTVQGLIEGEIQKYVDVEQALIDETH